MKYVRTFVVVAALAIVGSLTACGSTEPPTGCPDTAPDNIKGKVIGKQKDVTKPELIASNGQECWHLEVANTSQPGTILSVYVSKQAFDTHQVGDSFTREMVRTNK